MNSFVAGIVLGSLLTAGIGMGGQFYDRSGQPNAPAGSIQSFDYFRSRQQSLDLNAIRRTQEYPCAR